MATIKELYDEGCKTIQRLGTGKIIDLRPDDCMYHTTLTAFDAIVNDWEPVSEKIKKSIMLYRYLIADKHGLHCLTDWSTKNSEGWVTNKNYKVLKTEEKTIEYEE